MEMPRKMYSASMVRKVIQRRRRRERWRTALTVAGLVFLMAMVAYAAASPRGQAMQDPRLQKLLTIIDLVKDRYVEEVDDSRLLEGAVRGAVEALDDPYSYYLDPQQYRNLMIRATGEYQGIGIIVGIKDGYVTVIAPIKGTPAERAGMQGGDRILRVDGRDITNLTLDEVAQLIRGPAGTKVTLTISRPGREELLTFEITRARVKIVSVEHEMVAPGIGYLRITTFNENTPAEVREALDDLRACDMKGLILDLRHNPGGLLSQCVEVADHFVPPGPVTEIISREGKSEVLKADSPPLGVPLVVLVDRGTASASEILAGAIQDTGTGILVGTRTFGKGTMQHLINMPDGSGLKLTTARFYTPEGRKIDGVGLEPDVAVPVPEDFNPFAVPREEDPQFQKALQIITEKVAGEG